jgi:hypothetical protein
MMLVASSVADPEPGPCAFLTPGFGIRDPGWVNNQRMNILDHISESSETIFWFKILIFFDADVDPGYLNDPGSGTEKNSDPG